MNVNTLKTMFNPYYCINSPIFPLSLVRHFHYYKYSRAKLYIRVITDPLLYNVVARNEYISGAKSLH